MGEIASVTLESTVYFGELLELIGDPPKHNSYLMQIFDLPLIAYGKGESRIFLVGNNFPESVEDKKQLAIELKETFDRNRANGRNMVGLKFYRSKQNNLFLNPALYVPFDSAIYSLERQQKKIVSREPITDSASLDNFDLLNEATRKEQRIVRMSEEYHRILNFVNALKFVYAESFGYRQLSEGRLRKPSITR